MKYKAPFFAILIMAFIVGAGIIMPASAQSQSESETPLTIDINFSQHYEFIPCPSNIPVGDGCLNVTDTAKVPFIGNVSVQRIVFFNGSSFDPNHPTCLPDETNGTLTLAGGTLTFHAPGNVCFVDGTATYGLIITGGTGRYQGAIGGGQITVPPPLTGSTGRELWHIVLYLNKN